MNERMRRSVPSLLILLGAGLLVFGLMSYNPAGSGRDFVQRPFSHGASYPLASKSVAAVGAVGLAAGLLLRKRS